MTGFIKHNFRWIAGGFLLTFFSSFGQTFFISASVEEWQNLFDLSHGEFGRIYMLATLASAASLPFLGKFVDTIPMHKMIAFTVPLLAIATVLAAFAPTVSVLIFAIFMLRLFGQGMMTHIALTATGQWFNAQRGRAVSLVVLGHQGGEAILPLIFAAITLALGFQAGWISAALALLIIGLPLGVWAYSKPRTPDSEPTSHSNSVVMWTRAQVVRDPIFWVLLIGVLAPAFIGTTIFFHQDYLTALRGWPPQLFAQGLSVMAVTTLVFALINGALIDRFGAIAILPFFLLPLAVACFTLSLNVSAHSLFLFMFFLGISYGLSSTLFGALWPEVYGTRHLGAIRALIVSAMVFATAAGPGITGTMIDMGVDFPRQVMIMGVYCLFGAAAMTVIYFPLRARHVGKLKESRKLNRQN